MKFLVVVTPPSIYQDEFTVVEIDEEIIREEEPAIKLEVENEGTTPNVETEMGIEV